MSIGTGGIVVAVVLVVVILALIWALASAMRSTPKDVSRSVGAVGPVGPAPDQLRPVLVDFHVHGDTAEVYYGVPLPSGGIDDHLRDVLFHDASLVLHEKRSHGLPIGQVVRAVGYGRRGEDPVEVGVIDLEEPGVIPEIAAPELVPHAFSAGFDPLAHIGEQEFEVVPSLASRTPDEGLPPFYEDLVLARSVESKLRAAGVDPEHMTLSEFALTLLAAGGYQLVLERLGSSMPDGSSASMYRAQGGGTDALVVIVPQSPGEHPELSERVINAFIVEVAQRSPQRALLITDKTGPYIIYDKERADPRCRFITRERLQAFADSFALR